MMILTYEHAPSVPLTLLALLAAARPGAGAGATWPVCRPGDCAAAEPLLIDGWLTRHYITDGKRMSVSIRDGGTELHWRCARGASALGPASPRFAAPHHASAVHLVGCQTPSDSSYSELLQHLNINTMRLNISFHQTRPFNALLTNTILSELSIQSERGMVQLENDFSHFDGTLKRLSLQQISMTVDQFNSARNVVDLSLTNTGLEEIPVLSQFTTLERLAVREPRLLDTTRLMTAPALRYLTLNSPDAGVPYLPLLKNATFINLYDMERFFGNCSNLEILVMERGLLSALRPRLLAGCARLQRLRLTALPSGLLAAAAALQHLDLSHNALQTLPVALLVDTIALSLLDLSYNKLQNLPDDLLNRTELITHLDVSHNLLMAVPGNLLSGTPKLEYLNLSHNLLKVLPDLFLISAINIASNLKLDLDFNKLHELPNDLMVNMELFKYLNVSHNSDQLNSEL